MSQRDIAHVVAVVTFVHIQWRNGQTRKMQRKTLLVLRHHLRCGSRQARVQRTRSLELMLFRTRQVLVPYIDQWNWCCEVHSTLLAVRRSQHGQAQDGSDIIRSTVGCKRTRSSMRWQCVRLMFASERRSWLEEIGVSMFAAWRTGTSTTCLFDKTLRNMFLRSTVHGFDLIATTVENMHVDNVLSRTMLHMSWGTSFAASTNPLKISRTLCSRICLTTVRSWNRSEETFLGTPTTSSIFCATEPSRTCSRLRDFDGFHHNMSPGNISNLFYEKLRGKFLRNRFHDVHDLLAPECHCCDVNHQNDELSRRRHLWCFLRTTGHLALLHKDTSRSCASSITTVVLDRLRGLHVPLLNEWHAQHTVDDLHPQITRDFLLNFKVGIRLCVISGTR